MTELDERTGVEMEALTACAVTALTLLNVLVDVDPEASIDELTLWHKSGGRSGDWGRTDLGERESRPSTSATPADSNLSH